MGPLQQGVAEGFNLCGDPLQKCSPLLTCRASKATTCGTGRRESRFDIRKRGLTESPL